MLTHHRFARRFAAGLSLAAALAAPPAHAAAAGTWLRIGDPPNPPAFWYEAAAYDSSGDRVLVYNPTVQWQNGQVAAADVWEFRLAHPDSGWRLLAASGSAPVGRAGASVVVDEAHRRLLLYGGYPSVGGTPMSNDLFALPLDGPPAWSVVPATTDTLRARLDAFLTVDVPRNRLVLHGGSAYFGDHYGIVNDVWTLPLDGPAAWTNVPVTGALPPDRSNAQYAWDPARVRLMRHGGTTGSGSPVPETLALTVGTTAHWESLATTGPQIARSSGGMLVDVPNDRLVLAPGIESGYPPPASHNFVWQLPLAPGGEWSVVATADSFNGSGMVYETLLDSRRQRLVATGTIFTQALALADTTGWRRLWPPDPVRAPGPVSDAVLVTDPAHAALWMVGGTEQAGFTGLWRLDVAAGAQWTRYAAVSPLPLAGHAAALDAAGQRILDYSGYYEPPAVLAIDLDGVPTRTSWAPRDTAPPARVEHTVVVDPVRRQLVLFGGQIYLAHFNGHSYGDVWTLPLDDLTAWAPCAPAGPGPGARGAHFAFWDDAHDRMVILGGWQQSGGPIRRYFRDAWALSFAGTPAWAKLDSTAWDPPETGSLTYDPVNRRLFLFHGDDWNPVPQTRVWMRGVDDGDDWVLLETAGTPPAASAPIAFAPWCDRLVVTSTNLSGPQNDEVWALQLDHAVPALVSLEGIEAGPDRVTLAWRVGGAGPYTLSRRVNGDGWTTLAELSPDGAGRLAFEDRDVVPGQRLTYRLLEGARTLAEHAVSVPLRTGFGFAGARPSPARGAARLAFALPADSPVRFELFDVRGARVLSRELGPQGAGEHLWEWPETAGLRPGLYVARLTANRGRREAKVVLLP